MKKSELKQLIKQCIMQQIGLNKDSFYNENKQIVQNALLRLKQCNKHLSGYYIEDLN